MRADANPISIGPRCAAIEVVKQGVAPGAAVARVHPNVENLWPQEAG